MPMNEGAGFLADTLGTAFAILVMTLGPILAVAALCLVVRPETHEEFDMNGTADGPGTGFVGDPMGQMMGALMMGMMLGGGLVFLLLIAVLILAATAHIKYLRRPA